MNGELSEAEALIRERLADRWWRLNNLYWIEDENGRKVKFRCNWAQTALYKDLWHLNLVLKARQLGISSFVLIYGLDCCLFDDGAKTFGIVDKTDDDAKKKLSKVQFAYDHLDDPDDPTTSQLGALIKAKNKMEVGNTKELAFTNGSKVWAGTSLRGGTVQILLVSELGYTAFHFPDKAEEIRAGAFNTVHKGNIVVVESTHEGGRYGLFYDMVKLAQEAPAKLTPLDWKFHFFPWHGNPSYALDLPEPVTLTAEQYLYFERLADEGVTLTDAQRNWYVKKAATIKDAMLKEFPSTPTECFHSVVTGSIYGKIISDLRVGGRIRDFEFERSVPFYTFWDVGMSDFTAIWLVQLVGLDITWVDSYCCNAEPPAHYVRWCKETEKRFDHHIGCHYLPHDADNRGPSGKTYVDLLREAGLRDIRVVPRTQDIWVGINHLRDLLPRSYFHASNCGTEWKRLGRTYPSGLTCLEAYHTKDDSSGAITREMPVHDETSHFCDAARTFAEAHNRGMLEGTSSTARESIWGTRQIITNRQPNPATQANRGRGYNGTYTYITRSGRIITVRR